MNWNNELQCVNNFKFIRFGEKDLKKVLELRKRMKISHVRLSKTLLAMPVNKKNLLSKSIDLDENNQPTECVMEVESILWIYVFFTFTSI